MKWNLCGIGSCILVRGHHGPHFTSSALPYTYPPSQDATDAVLVGWIKDLQARLAAVEAERDEAKRTREVEFDLRLAATSRAERAEAERDEARRADDQRTGEWNRALERAERAEARLALAERVVEAAKVVVTGNHACVEKRKPYGCGFCDALRAALAAWREGEPHPSLNVAICTPPGCARHWEERNRELVRENDVLRSNSDHLSSENASLSRQVESMAMRIESLAEELAKPEDVRLREVLDALEGRAVIFDGLGARVGHLLDEMDEWIGRAGEAERAVEAAQRRLACVADDMTEHAYQELASALEAPPRVADRTTDFDPPGGTVGDALGLRGR